MNLHEKLYSLGWKLESNAGGYEAFFLRAGGCELMITSEDDPGHPAPDANTFALSVAPRGFSHDECSVINTKAFMIANTTPEEIPQADLSIMSAADCQAHGIELEDHPYRTVMLAKWPERSGWFTKENDPAKILPYWANVENCDECFATLEECLVWLYVRTQGL